MPLLALKFWSLDEFAIYTRSQIYSQVISDRHLPLRNNVVHILACQEVNSKVTG